MIIAGAGHRQARLGGYGREATGRVVHFAHHLVKYLNPRMGISGMALGWDQALATAFIQLGVPWIAAVPFEGQESVWPEMARVHYQVMLKHASEVKIVSPGGYSKEKMDLRNKWMVDQLAAPLTSTGYVGCDMLVSLWDGRPSGTKDCVDYAIATRKVWCNVWKYWCVYRHQEVGSNPFGVLGLTGGGVTINIPEH